MGACVDSACMSVHDSFVIVITLPVESVSGAVLKYQHLPCYCEWQSHNSEGVFRQLYADAWPLDHGWGHDMEMAGDEFLRWRVESKDEV